MNLLFALLLSLVGYTPVPGLSLVGDFTPIFANGEAVYTSTGWHAELPDTGQKLDYTDTYATNPVPYHVTFYDPARNLYESFDLTADTTVAIIDSVNVSVKDLTAQPDPPSSGWLRLGFAWPTTWAPYTWLGSVRNSTRYMCEFADAPDYGLDSTDVFVIDPRKNNITWPDPDIPHYMRWRRWDDNVQQFCRPSYQITFVPAGQ